MDRGRDIYNIKKFVIMVHNVTVPYAPCFHDSGNVASESLQQYIYLEHYFPHWIGWALRRRSVSLIRLDSSESNLINRTEEVTRSWVGA